MHSTIERALRKGREMFVLSQFVTLKCFCSRLVTQYSRSTVEYNFYGLTGFVRRKITWVFGKFTIKKFHKLLFGE